ncbi:hypothetical protein [Kitasatospora sp. NPDC091207]|uniref:hypothetical protein n=1 Tax=Kitasatospora sp. NPDC091207 TaxID=3364083 RepID=UPI003811D80B
MRVTSVMPICGARGRRLPATGREGLPPVALVFEAGRKRTRPGAAPFTDERRQEKEKTHHRRLLRRIYTVEAASEATWYPPSYRGEETTARDYHRALPVVATSRPLPRARGADAAIWRRFGRLGRHTLSHALDNPDGDQLLHTEQATVERVRREREKEEYERRCPLLFRYRFGRFSGRTHQSPADETVARVVVRVRSWSRGCRCRSGRRCRCDRRARPFRRCSRR